MISRISLEINYVRWWEYFKHLSFMVIKQLSEFLQLTSPNREAAISLTKWPLGYLTKSKSLQNDVWEIIGFHFFALQWLNLSFSYCRLDMEDSIRKHQQNNGTEWTVGKICIMMLIDWDEGKGVYCHYTCNFRRRHWIPKKGNNETETIYSL